VGGVGEQRLRHINDSVLSSLKMEGIRFFFKFRLGPKMIILFTVSWQFYGFIPCCLFLKRCDATSCLSPLPSARPLAPSLTCLVYKRKLLSVCLSVCLSKYSASGLYQNYLLLYFRGMVSGSLLPWHVASPVCGWRNGHQYGGYIRIY
jgi:hypothetical protein